MPVDRAYAFIELSSLEAPLSALGYTVVTDEPTATLRLARPAIGSDSVYSVGLKPSPAEDIRLVACDAHYRFELADGVQGDLANSLAIINRYLPVGHCEQDPDGTIHARWTIPTDSRLGLDQELVITSIVLFDLLQQHFGDYLEEVCNGEIDSSLLEAVIEASGDTI
jgi:hypothetical protein